MIWRVKIKIITLWISAAIFTDKFQEALIYWWEDFDEEFWLTEFCSQQYDDILLLQVKYL